MTKQNQDRFMTAFLVVAVLVLCILAASCSTTASTPAPAPPKEQFVDYTRVAVPTRGPYNDLIVICWNGFRVFANEYSSNGPTNIAVVRDERC